MPDFAIRALHRRDARAYRAFRLDALEHYPASFATSVAEWSALPLRRIADMLTPTGGSAVFGALRDDGTTGERLVGIAGLKRQDREKYRHKAMVWGMYVDSDWRGQGVARSMLERLIDHARAQAGLRHIVLTVTDGNAAAQALYERLGFRVYGVEPKAIDPGDGSYRDEVLMWLNLQGA